MLSCRGSLFHERGKGEAPWVTLIESFTHGFTRQQGSVYFGDATKVDAVTCVLAIMDIAGKYDWFAPSVSDIRMLRIEDNNGLMPAVLRASAGK
jgi:virulence-associated protein VapD